MSIKNRLKKIKSILNLDSEFCRCEREVIIKVQPREDHEEPEPVKICDDCGKEISQRRFTFNFNNNIETEVILPYRVIEPGDEEKRI